MIVRPLESMDLPAVREMFAGQEWEYELPSREDLVAAQVVTDNGKIVAAVLARPTVELYFLGDPHWKTPRWRMEALKKIHESMRRELRAKGYRDANVWIPPQKKSFVRRLMRTFRWTAPLWTNLTRSTEN